MRCHVDLTEPAAIYTDDRDRLASVIEGRDGTKVGAIDEMLIRKGAAIAIPAPVRAAGMEIRQLKATHVDSIYVIVPNEFGFVVDLAKTMKLMLH